MRFYVNVDHVATLRQARRATEPDPVDAAILCERAGADAITVHLREDRRHIQDRDVERLAERAAKRLNLELATAPDIVGLARTLRPLQATFVPERREEITTEGGLSLTIHRGRPDPRLVAAVEELKAVGIRVSLFIDPDRAAIDAAAAIGAEAVELHTGEYANAFPKAEAALKRLEVAAQHAADVGIAAHAGHGLTYENVTPVAAISPLEELNIGHCIISRSVMVGIEQAVREMKALITGARV
jgi:pyridoxine 5-phosphate synthase